MRGVIVGIALAISVSACGSAPEADPVEQADTTAAAGQDEGAAEKTANANLEAVSYPKCDAAFSGEKVTSCGRKVFSAAMTECRKRTNDWKPNGAAIDEYTGDSWQRAAGSSVAANDEQRLKVLSPSDVSQEIGIAVGQGTSNIQIFQCDLGPDLKLKNITATRVVHKPV